MGNRVLQAGGIIGLSVCLLLGVALLASRTDIANAAAPKQTDQTVQRQITVTGTGKVTAEPDLATISIGVQITEPTLAAATQKASEAMTKVLDAIKAAGVDAKDIQTSTYSVNPLVDYRDGQTPTVTGYQVMNVVTVKVRDLDSVGQVLDAGMSAGANYLGGVTFGIEDPSVLENEARTAAVKNATAIAETLAAAAGVELGNVVSITEGIVTTPPPMPYMDGRVMAAESASAGPVETGSLEITSNVVMRFEISQ